MSEKVVKGVLGGGLFALGGGSDVDKLKAAQARQRRLIEERERKQAKVDAAQQRVRSGGRGLLSYVGEQLSGLLGG